MTFRFFDKSLNRLETEEGVLTMQSLFLPYFIEMILMSMIGTVNTIFLSHSSSQSVAAVGAASQLVGMILTFYGVVSSGASIVISQNLGAGNKRKASDAAVISIMFSAILSILLGIILTVFAGNILTMMHLKDNILTQATSYFRTIIQFSFVQAITSSLSAILRSYGRPRTAVKVSICVNILNATFCYLIVFRPFEIPLYGVAGIAVGSVISQFCGLLFMLFLFRRASLDIHFSKELLGQLSIISTILRIGIPGGITALSYSLSQVVSTSIIATLNPISLPTKIYVENIVYYVYVLGLALGMSTSIMIGRLVGAKEYDQAYRLNRQNLKITIICNVLLSLTINLLSGFIIRLFTQDITIINLARTILLVDLFVEIGRGFNHIEANSLRGAGDVVFPMAVSIASCWVVSILFSYILGVRLGLGLFGCWMAFAMDEMFRGTLFFLRWGSRKWTTKGIV